MIRCFGLLTALPPRRQRQMPYLSSILSPNIPTSLAPYLPASTSQKTYHASQKYAKAKMSFGSILAGLDQAETVLLLTGVLSPVWTALVEPNGADGGWTLLYGLWSLSERALEAFGKSGEIKQSLVFVVITTLLSTVLSTPKEYYKNFVLEEKHGFNKMTKKTFWVDQVQGASPASKADRARVADGPFCEQGSSCPLAWNFRSSPGSSGSSTVSARTAC